MAAPVNAPLTPFFTVSTGMVVRLTALDATTGALVNNVVISNAAIDADYSAQPVAPVKPDPVKGAYTQGTAA